MSKAALKSLNDVVKRRLFNPAYYICGEDDFQKEDAMKQLIGAAIEPAMRDFNLDVRRAQDVDPKSLDALLSSMPMMAERRAIVIRDAGLSRKTLGKPSSSISARPLQTFCSCSWKQPPARRTRIWRALRLFFSST
jgi:DNA polymerase-3 subunit delta